MSKTGITIGKVAAGAGMAAGAVLVAGAMGVDPSAIGEYFTPDEAAAAVDPGQGFQFFANEAQRAAGDHIMGMTNTGAALLGTGGLAGGYVLKRTMDKAEKHEHARDMEAQLNNPVQGGFVEAEQMRAMQGLMKARMAAANPGYAAQQGPQMG